MQLGELTFGQLVGACAVVLLLLTVYNTAMTSIKNHLDAKKRNNAPVDELKIRVDEHEEFLANDKRRINEMEERVCQIRQESGMTLRGVRALLSHELNGNSEDKMKACYDSIDEYLISKK